MKHWIIWALLGLAAVAGGSVITPYGTDPCPPHMVCGGGGGK